MASKKKNEIVCRRPLGPKIICGGKAIPSVYMLYEITYADGTRDTEYGHSVHTLPGFQALNGTKKQKKKAMEEVVPELSDIIQAASILLNRLEQECMYLDRKRGVKIGWKDQWENK